MASNNQGPPDLNNLSREEYERYLYQQSQNQRQRSLTSNNPYENAYQHDDYDDESRDHFEVSPYTQQHQSATIPAPVMFTNQPNMSVTENPYLLPQADDSYYDPPGIIRGNSGSGENLQSNKQHLRFPSHSQFMDNASEQAPHPESYLLQNLPTSNRNVAMPRYQEERSDDRRSYDNYPDPEPENGRPPTFQVDNRIHNYYNASGILPESTATPRSHRRFLTSLFQPNSNSYDADLPNEAVFQNGAPQDFAPFPVASGDNYQINPFMNDVEDTETLLNSTPNDSNESDPANSSNISNLSNTQIPTVNTYPYSSKPYPVQSDIPIHDGTEYSEDGETDDGQSYMPESYSSSGLGPAQLYQQSQPSQIFNSSQHNRINNAPPNITVKLYHGHLVLDCHVPQKIKNVYREFLSNNPEHKKGKETPREFAFMRYSAVTCDPEDFTNQFGLRQQLYGLPRTTEIFICVTLYNESEDLLARTLHGLAKNLYLLTKRKEKEWGTIAWKKIVVCIVADGREKLNKRTRTLMERLGVFQNGLAKNIVGSKPVKAHLYEYSTLMGVNNVKKTVGFGSLKVPMQIIFCLKENNKGKINSHRWFFQAFSKALQPRICVLLDAGTVPGNDAIYHLWNTFETKSNVGGACGEIRASLGRGWHKLSNPLVAAQNFEYKMSNILDKPMESVCGFISVLPGAFSAYRYRALVNMDGFNLLQRKNYFTPEGPHKTPFQIDRLLKEENSQTEQLGVTTQSDVEAVAQANAAEANKNLIMQKDPIADDPLMADSPLGQYFKGETMKLQGKSAGIFTANMYLAEDRILCFELVTKKGENWLLKYVKSAHATTDVPERLSELVLQRRRWLNGSFFAAIYSIAHVYHLFRSRHNILRKLILLAGFGYQTFSLLFSWFGIGNFFLVFRILTKSLSDKSLEFAPGNVLSVVFLWIYCACIIAIFVLSFGNRPKGTPFFYTIVVCFFAVLMAYLLFASIYISVKSIIYTLCITGGRLTVSFIFHNPLFRDLVVSLMSTYALYIVSSLLFLEPWHIITSSLQYLLISPSYINVLNVYAFCNLHDISWGTKGDDKIRDDLGRARIKNDEEVETFLPNHRSLIDRAYESAIAELNKPAPVVEEKPSEEDKTKDWYAMFRSIVVLFWVFSNLALIAVVLNTTGLSAISSETIKTAAIDNPVTKLLTRRDLIPQVLSSSSETTSAVANYIEMLTLAIRQAAPLTPNNCGTLGVSGTVQTEIYLTVVLWSVAGLAAFRFIGSLIYLFLRLIGPY